MHFHAAGSTRFICYCCTLCSCKGHNLSGVGSRLYKMFYCSTPRCLRWTRNKSWYLLFSLHCDSPASFLCSCGVWNPSRLLLWLHCVCGNNYLDLWGTRKHSYWYSEIIGGEFVTFIRMIPKERNDHVRCLRTINPEHPLSFLHFMFSSAKLLRNIFSLFLPLAVSSRVESFGILCQGFEISAFEVSAATPAQRKWNLMYFVVLLALNNHTLITQQQPVNIVPYYCV